MKFGKRLQQQIEETLPEWRDKFLSYKLLKKRLKLIAAECFTDDAFGRSLNQQQAVSNESTGSVNRSSATIGGQQQFVPGLTVQEIEFIRLLNLELEKFNAFFIDKEEDYVMRLPDLKDRIDEARRESGGSFVPGSPGNEEMLRIWKDLVTIHGEMVLLENYSSINYTGLVKILKKHDRTMKHGTGALLSLPYIRRVLQQPFYKTELLSNLVRECDSNLQALLPCAFLGETVTNPGENSPPLVSAAREIPEDAGTDEDDPETDAENVEVNSEMEGIFRSTVAALHTIHELRNGSSTSFIVPARNRSDEENLGVVVDESTVSC